MGVLTRKWWSGSSCGWLFFFPRDTVLFPQHRQPSKANQGSWTFAEWEGGRHAQQGAQDLLHSITGVIVGREHVHGLNTAAPHEIFV